jgi:hypothetical protein
MQQITGAKPVRDASFVPPKHLERCTPSARSHFGKCEEVRLADNDRSHHSAEVFGLRNGCVSSVALRFA